MCVCGGWGWTFHKMPKPWKTWPDHFPTVKLYSGHYAFGLVAFSWYFPNSNLSIRLPDIECNSLVQKTSYSCSRVFWQCALHHTIPLTFGLVHLWHCIVHCNFRPFIKVHMDSAVIPVAVWNLEWRQAIFAGFLLVASYESATLKVTNASVSVEVCRGVSLNVCTY